MGFLADLRIIYHMTFAKVAGASQTERLEAFYRVQAHAYDDYRRRLLHGREEMMRSLPMPEGGLLLDIGGGTGSNLEHLGPERARLRRATIVDLCPSLLKVAKERIERHGWNNVTTVAADATTYEPPEPVDVVTFSYSLTMIPDWFKVIDRAQSFLKPGGAIGVADFYVARKWPGPALRTHSRFQRFFWPMMFSYDNVFLSPEHLPYLQHRFETVRLEERLGKMPYMLGLKVPYYIFVGRKGPAPLSLPLAAWRSQ
jgi:S-adenosylmethionine-diacylgycerolhomoserine-N-methlytransferase